MVASLSQSVDRLHRSPSPLPATAKPAGEVAAASSPVPDYVAEADHVTRPNSPAPRLPGAWPWAEAHPDGGRRYDKPSRPWTPTEMASSTGMSSLPR